MSGSGRAVQHHPAKRRCLGGYAWVGAASDEGRSQGVLGAVTSCGGGGRSASGAALTCTQRVLAAHSLRCCRPWHSAGSRASSSTAPAGAAASLSAALLPQSV